MPTKKAAHVAVTFDDKIYVFGGLNDTGALTSADMYDPEENSWTNLAPMLTQREHLDAVVINLFIYIIGGRNSILGSLKNTNRLEVYSPILDQWQIKANLPAARSGFGAASLNGKLYVFGGEDLVNLVIVPTVEEYDPISDIWREVTPMTLPRHGMGAVTIGNSIFIIGGGPVAGALSATGNNDVFTISQ